MKQVALMWSLSVGVSFLFWDLCTLFLYICKVNSFQKYKNTEPTVYKRIMRILNKITILTLFYQISIVVVLLMFSTLDQLIETDVLQVIISRIRGCLLSFSISCSMFLMLDHNKKQYIKFLQCIYYLKCHWICCKWRYMVIDQLNEALIDTQTLSSNVINNKEKSIELETRNMSVNDQKIATNGNELSVETITYN
eukprot:186369_1